MKVDELFEKYKIEAKILGLKLFTQTPEENVKLVSWYLKLVENKELMNIARPDLQAMLPFMSLFEGALVFYTLAEDGSFDRVIWAKATDSNLLGPGEVGFWFKGNTRLSFQSIKIGILIHRILFDIFPSLVAYTWRESKLAFFQKVGYNAVGLLNGLYGKERVYILQNNKESFEKSKLFAIGG